jgi:serine/threonine protein kinase
MVGTITYMAPELLQIEPFYNYKIDIWSFGLILHELKRGN